MPLTAASRASWSVSATYTSRQSRQSFREGVLPDRCAPSSTASQWLLMKSGLKARVRGMKPFSPAIIRLGDL